MKQLPKYHETFIPILETLSNGEALRSREMATKVRDSYYSSLSQELLEKTTKSGANVLLDRIGWGKSYLKMGKILVYPQRGYVQITDKGKKILEKGRFSLTDLQNDTDFINHRRAVERKKEDEEELKTETLEHASPQDLIDSGISTIEAEVKTELLERLKEVDPYYFEKGFWSFLKVWGMVILWRPKNRVMGVLMVL